MSNSFNQQKETPSNKLEFTGERLVSGHRILQPQRIENLARFNFFTKWISQGEVLDYGCGLGEGTHFLNQINAYQVVGLDISFDAIFFAKNNWGELIPDFICGDILSPGLNKDTFDGVISVEVIEHLGDADRFLKNISSLLKPDGVCMLTTPNKLISSPRTSSLWPDHVKEYEPKELQNLCEDYFRDVILYGEYIPVFEKHVIRKLAHKLSPIIKPILPKWLRIRALPFLFSIIKSDLKQEDILFSPINIQSYPTIVAICRKPIK